jgi:adenosylmethionine-8-amino-7-oxononanoate aminotransferase
MEESLPVIRRCSVAENTEGVNIMLKGKKTYITGFLGIIGALAGYAVGDINPAETAQLVLTAVLSMTVRNSIPK